MAAGQFSALSYAETELQYHDAMQETDSSRSIYVRKALLFVRKMLKYYQVRLHRGGAFDGGEKTNQRQDEAAAMRGREARRNWWN